MATRLPRGPVDTPGLQWLVRQFIPETEKAIERASRMQSFTVTTLPDASANILTWIYVSDASGGPSPAFSDGADWRLPDGTIVS